MIPGSTLTIITTLTKANVADFETVREAMRDETRRYIEHVVLDEGGGSRELFTDRRTYPSAELAAFYGFPAPGADGSVERPEGQGVGILAQGSILANEAHSNSSSPMRACC